MWRPGHEAHFHKSDAHILVLIWILIINGENDKPHNTHIKTCLRFPSTLPRGSPTQNMRDTTFWLLMIYSLSVGSLCWLKTTFTTLDDFRVVVLAASEFVSGFICMLSMGSRVGLLAGLLYFIGLRVGPPVEILHFTGLCVGLLTRIFHFNDLCVSVLFGILHSIEVCKSLLVGTLHFIGLREGLLSETCTLWRFGPEYLLVYVLHWFCVGLLSRTLHCAFCVVFMQTLILSAFSPFPPFIQSIICFLAASNNSLLSYKTHIIRL